MRSPRKLLSRVSLVGSLAVAMLAGCSAHEPDPLIERLSAADPEARREAALALGRLGTDGSKAVEALVNSTADDDPGVRQAACRALGEIGPSTASVLSALQEALADSEFPVRLAAAFALLKLDPGGEAYRPVLTNAMQQGEGGTIVAIGQLGPAGQWAVPTLTRLLRDRRPGIRRISAEALGRIGPDEEAVRALTVASERDPDDRVRETATRVLAGEK